MYEVVQVLAPRLEPELIASQVNDNSRIRPPTIQLRWGQHYVILHRDVIEWMFKSVEVMHLLGWYCGLSASNLNDAQGCQHQISG